MKYNRISAKFWTDEKVLQWDNETRILALYLLTCPHKTTEGLFRLPKQYICADLDWSMEGLDKPFNKLLKDGFIKYDERVKVILLTRALKYQSPDNPNQEKAAISLLKELPETDLLYEFIRQAERFSERFYQRLVEQFGKPPALSLTPTLTLTQENNIRPDSEKNPDDAARKTETENEKNSNQNQPADTKQQSEDKTMEMQNNQQNKNTGKEKNDQNPGCKISSAMEFDSNSMPYKTCCFLIDRIIDNNSRARVPNKDPTDRLLQKWCQELDKLHRLGPLGARKDENKGYSWQEIWQIINWCQQDQFWKANILSAATLRKQVIKLENRMKQSPGKKGNKRMELLKEIYLEAQEDDEKGGFDPL